MPSFTSTGPSRVRMKVPSAEVETIAGTEPVKAGTSPSSNREARSSSRCRRTALPETWTHPQSVRWSMRWPTIVESSLAA